MTVSIASSKGNFSGSTLEEIVSRVFGSDAEATRHPTEDGAYLVSRYVGGERPYLVIGTIYSVRERRAGERLS